MKKLCTVFIFFLFTAFRLSASDQSSQLNQSDQSNQSSQSNQNELKALLVSNDYQGIEEYVSKQENAADEAGWYPLHYAAAYGDAKSLEIVLAALDDVHVRDGEGNVPLINAMLFSNYETFRALLDSTDLYQSNRRGGFPFLYLMYLPEETWEDALRAFLGCGQNINQRTGEAVTLLNYAVMGGHEKLVKLLLENGASIIFSDASILLYPIDYSVYITKNYTDMVLAGDSHWEKRKAINALLAEYGGEERNIPNTIGITGNYFMTMINIISTVNQRAADVQEINRQNFFTEYTNLSGGTDIIITKEDSVRMLETCTGKKINLDVYYGDFERVLREAAESEEVCYVIVNMGNSPYVTQYWAAFYGESAIEGFADCSGTFTIMDPVFFRMKDISTVIIITAH
ncbi:MAG: ankyrin repeat domain-containing protein [Treponema sp.]|jgi:ankyrin repeat protein|nr:ankyrin repeat domain-containing protein [Treponema sp.]